MRRLFSPFDLSIKGKLILICTITTASALFLTSVVFISTEFISLRRSLVNNLFSFAGTVASNVKGAVAFNDEKSAEETLSTLDSVPTISRAAVYDRNGLMFASYRRESTISVPDTLPLAHGAFRFGVNHVEVSQPIILDKEIIGNVTVTSDLSFFYSRMAVYIAILFGVMGLSLLASYLMLAKLQLIVTKPILNLAGLMEKISRKRDYSIRAKIYGRDEIGSLAHGFNEMLTKIQARDEELELYRKHLEELVKKRTSQLSEANNQLKQELTERLRAEKALVESEHRYRTIFETTGNPSLIADDSGTISLVNTAFEKWSGYSRKEVEGKSWMNFCFGEDRPKMKHYHDLRNSDPEAAPGNYEVRLLDREGNVHNTYLSVAVIPASKRTVCSILDLTELKRLEEQLRQSQKMEAIGRLAGGVAHDFNNILTAIIGYASLIQMKMARTDPLRSYVNSVLASAERAAHLTTGLLAFSRKQVIAPKPLDLNSVIKNVQQLLGRIIGEDIELRTDCPPHSITVFADQGQIEQVLINLATNARDAMPEGGVLSITIEIVVLPETTSQTRADQKPGNYALITVSDTGIGMSKKTVESIFEPFFTTKEVGKGTGLGLSIVYGIIKQHNGYVDVCSEPGSGTIFRIYLPLVDARDQGNLKAAASRGRTVGGNQTILVAEDDVAARALIKEVLETYGYSVIEAVDGEDAVNRFEEHRDNIDLVVIDVIMPKKNGRAVYEHITKTRPRIRTLFISGYTADIINEKGISDKNLNFLSKPVAPDLLVAKVREVLDLPGT